jgi:hypothetical protein
VDTELAQSQVNGKKEYFVRIGTFGSSPSLTATDQFASGMNPLQCPHEAGNSFRQLLNEASETTEETTGKTTDPHTKETTNMTTEETTEETTEGTTEQTTEGTTEPTLRCIGWSGEAHRKVIRLSTHATMRDTKNTAKHLPVKFPLCGSFTKRDGYNKLEIGMTLAAS